MTGRTVQTCEVNLERPAVDALIGAAYLYCSRRRDATAVEYVDRELLIER